MITVNDMYKYASEHDLMLLSTYQATFWQEYRSNHKRYDKLFRRLYKSYRYFLQECNEDIETVTQNFMEDVYNHLLANDKKYEELYRIYVITDEDYSIIDNYRIKETMDRDTTSNNSNTYGARSDSGSNAYGQQSNHSVGKVAPYDSENFYNQNSLDETIGSRNDTNSFSKGSQSDTLNNTGTEDYTLTRRGNIGVQTGTDMLKKHNDYWNTYKFYTDIFNDICAELLLV